MMRPDAKVQKVYLYPKPVDFRKSINGLAALVELDIKVEVFNPVLFVFLNRTRSQVKILYWERNGFCLWLKRLEAERFKTKPDAGDDRRRFAGLAGVGLADMDGAPTFADYRRRGAPVMRKKAAARCSRRPKTEN